MRDARCVDALAPSLNCSEVVGGDLNQSNDHPARQAPGYLTLHQRLNQQRCSAHGKPDDGLTTTTTVRYCESPALLVSWFVNVSHCRLVRVNLGLI